MKNGFSRDFVLVVIGQIISLFGNAVVRFALPVHLLEVTGSAAVLGVVSGLAFLPMALMAPIGGIVADRVNKRNIMVFLDFFTCGLILLFLILYDRVDLVGMVLILLLLLYGISGAYQPSVQASIPVLVEESRVMQANAVVNMVSSLSGLLGPALGGAAYSVWGILPVMAVAAGCFFCSAVMEIFIHIPYTKRTGRLPLLREAAGECISSIVYITREKPEVGKLTLCAAGVNLFMSGLMIIGLPVIVMQELGFDPAEGSRMYGYMQAVLGAGGLAGGLGAGVLGQRMRMEQSYRFLRGSVGPYGACPCSALPALCSLRSPCPGGSGDHGMRVGLFHTGHGSSTDDGACASGGESDRLGAGAVQLRAARGTDPLRGAV